MAADLSIEDLREELRFFAQHTLREELQALKRDIVDELHAGQPAPLSLACAELGSSEGSRSSPRRRLQRKSTWRWGRLPRGTVRRGSEAREDASADGRGAEDSVLEGTESELLAPSAKKPSMTVRRSLVYGRSERKMSSDFATADFTKPRAVEVAGPQAQGYAPLITPQVADEPSPTGACHGALQSFVQGSTFGMIFAFVLMVNVAWLGIQTDYLATHWTEEVPSYMVVVDTTFCALFTIEIALRMYAQGVYNFLNGEGWGWNIFELTIVVLQLVDAATETVFHADSGTNSASLRFLRLLRLVRAMRVARILHLVPQLRMLLVSIIDSVKTLFWTVLLVFLVTYSFGVSITQVVTDHKMRLTKEELEGHQRDLDEFYGSLSRSMLVLFESISEGMHWGEAMSPLIEHCSPWVAVAFVAYITFVLYAMMNVVTACFVESALRAAKEDQRTHMLQKLWDLFQTEDASKKAFVTEDTFNKSLDCPQMTSYLKALDLTPEEARQSHFFQLLDTDDSGGVDAQEFVTGCVRLTGYAKSVDLAAFMYEYREDAKTIKEHRKRVEASIEAIMGHISSVPPSQPYLSG